MKIPRFTAQMKEILVKGGQLTDEHIHLAQQLLKKQFPHLDGLQSTLLSETDGFEALQHEGIQIHHIRDPGHWVTSSSIGQSVAVYDSKFLGGRLSSSLTHQLALSYRLLVKTEDEDGEEMDPTLFIDVPYGTTSSVSVYSNFQQKANSGTVINVSSDCSIVLLHKVP